MLAVWIAFVAIVEIILGYFVPSAAAHGWSKKDFFLEILPNIKAVIIGVTLLIYYIPVFVSCVFYIMLLRAVKRPTKVGSSINVEPENDSVGVFTGRSVNEIEEQIIESLNHENADQQIQDIPSQVQEQMDPSMSATDEVSNFRNQISLNLFVSQGQMAPVRDEIESKNELNIEKEMLNRKEIQKNKDELWAAIKSIQTNFLVIVMGFVAAILIKQLPLELQNAFTVATNSAQKTLFPIVTTLVNFGVVRRVSVVFCQWLFKRWPDF